MMLEYEEIVLNAYVMPFSNFLISIIVPIWSLNIEKGYTEVSNDVSNLIKLIDNATNSGHPGTYSWVVLSMYIQDSRFVQERKKVLVLLSIQFR